MERTNICQSIEDLKTTREVFEDKIATLKTNASCSADSLSRAEANIDTLKKANQQLQNAVNALKDRKYTDFLLENFDSLLEEKMQNVILPGTTHPLSSEHNKTVHCFTTEIRLEVTQQYNRRDRLLFFGLKECENEDCVDKIVETAFEMAVEMMHDDVCVSNRLLTRNQRSDEPRPIVAKLTRRNTKNLIYESKHRLKFSEDQFHVFVPKQLTEKMPRALY